MADDADKDETETPVEEVVTGRVRRTLEEDEKRVRRAFLRNRRERTGRLEAEVTRHEERGVPSDKRPY